MRKMKKLWKSQKQVDKEDLESIFKSLGDPKTKKKYENLIHSSENFLSFIWQTTEPTIEIDHFIENDGQTVERIEEAEKRIIEEWKKSKSIESTSKWKVNDVDEWSKQTAENGCRWWCFFFFEGWIQKKRSEWSNCLEWIELNVSKSQVAQNGTSLTTKCKLPEPKRALFSLLLHFYGFLMMRIKDEVKKNQKKTVQFPLRTRRAFHQQQNERSSIQTQKKKAPASFNF